MLPPESPSGIDTPSLCSLIKSRTMHSRRKIAKLNAGLGTGKIASEKLGRPQIVKLFTSSSVFVSLLSLDGAMGFEYLNHLAVTFS